MQAMATCSCLMVALQAGKRLVVNPLLKLKFLSLETELRLLMLSTTVHRVNGRIIPRKWFEWPRFSGRVFCGLIEY